MKFAITFGFKDERGYDSEDIIILWADDEQHARRQAKLFLRTTHTIKNVQVANPALFN